MKQKLTMESSNINQNEPVSGDGTTNNSIKVLKRSGNTEDFDSLKIEEAILSAMKSSGIISYKVAQNISKEIEQELADKGNECTIKEIENLVYDKLIRKGHKLTAKDYEGYRSIREFQRSTNTIDGQINELLQGDSEYWKDENSNKNSMLLTVQRDYLAGIVSIDMARRKIFPPEVIQAHDEGLIHIHDLDYIGQLALTNCCLINLEDMLQNGTCINNTKIEKPHRLLTATTIATQIITAVSSNQYGGCTITLTHLAPFIRDSYNRYFSKYKKFGLDEEKCIQLAKIDTKKEVEDSVQTFNYQVNSMTNTNGQSPFLTVFMYLGETSEYKEELSMLIEEFLVQRLEGMPNEQGVMVTPAFPKLIYTLEEDNMNEDSKYWYLTKLAAKCSSKRLVPDYISEKKLKELKDGNCYPCMGCRSFLTVYKNEEDNFKFYGRFNQGVVTISLPDAALSSEGSIDNFYKILDERLELCHKALQIRHDRLCGIRSDVAPILWQHGAFARLKPGEKIDKLLYGGYSTISLGYAGLYECVKALTGESHTKHMDLAETIMQKLNDACKKWKAEENMDYSVYGSPIESTTYKFAKSLKARFGEIEGITDESYITNSYHVNVKEEINPLDKLKLEAEFQKLSPGGMISYIECADLGNNIEAVLEVIRYIYDNIPYAELNVKSDYCTSCGFDGEIEIIDEDGTLKWRCPNCGCEDQEKLHVARRTCGYIGSNKWNQGRTAEIRDRYTHLDDHEL
jgi:ribonucleoside-triphosphate reductase